ncbi:unnamed protein product [Mytilus edulis]|uniref:Uncharacterized protein n=1 Tax=Mytilus edulis TaxID=6550 RepID=A0A8S3RGL3_MYTED|nr:unnamed protein product [Mytilus edulis]
MQTIDQNNIYQRHLRLYQAKSVQQSLENYFRGEEVEFECGKFNGNRKDMSKIEVPFNININPYLDNNKDTSNNIDVPEKCHERKRGSKGKYEVKTSGTPQQIERRRKKISSTLQIFDKLTKASVAEEGLSYFCVLQRKNGEVHFSATDDLKQNFIDNKPILEFKDNMIETRRQSVLNKMHVAEIKHKSVKPSPSKGPSQMSFLPGLGAAQREELQNLSLQGENRIALNTESLENIKKRIWVEEACTAYGKTIQEKLAPSNTFLKAVSSAVEFPTFNMKDFPIFQELAFQVSAFETKLHEYMVNPLNTLRTDIATAERLLQEADMPNSVLIYDILLHHLEQPLTHVPDIRQATEEHKKQDKEDQVKCYQDTKAVEMVHKIQSTEEHKKQDNNYQGKVQWNKPGVRAWLVKDFHAVMSKHYCGRSNIIMAKYPGRLMTEIDLVLADVVRPSAPGMAE